MPGRWAVAHTVCRVGRRSNGLGAVAIHLSACQALAGCRSEVWCVDKEEEVRLSAEVHGLVHGHIRRFPCFGPEFLAYTPSMERAMRNAAGREFSIVHQHGIWTGLSRVMANWRHAHNCPTVVAAHGSLDGFALKRSLWKKKIALAAYERTNLSRATCLHALSEMESRNYRDFGLRNPVAVIPNGISKSWIEAQATPEAFRRTHSLPTETKILLYLSRITPKKGLPMLLEALAGIKCATTDWRLVIAGKDEFDHQRELVRLVDRLDLRGLVVFTGPLFGEMKRNAFAAADLFVLPSHSEGAPVVILEALGAGVPVLTTKASPWSELETRQCGWWTDIRVDAIATALSEALATSRAKLTAMGDRGRELVAQRYTWNDIANRTLELYEWLLGRQPRPSFVLLD
jgi:glycosyltransferase involved in cell wall biosynthesis